MAMLTEELILAYSVGGITDPDLRRRIEHAREYDPLVQLWFDLYSPTGVERQTEEWLRRADRQMALEDEPPTVIFPKESGQ